MRTITRNEAISALTDNMTDNTLDDRQAIYNLYKYGWTGFADYDDDDLIRELNELFDAEYSIIDDTPPSQEAPQNVQNKMPDIIE